MRLRLPVHIWAMLSVGREAESVKLYSPTTGIRMCQRWREHDGERHDSWRTPWDGEPSPRMWREEFWLRWRWTRTGGVWRGEWAWRNIWQTRRPSTSFVMTIPDNGAAIPQKILLLMIRFCGVRFTVNHTVRSLLNMRTGKIAMARCVPSVSRMVRDLRS